MGMSFPRLSYVCAVAMWAIMSAGCPGRDDDMETRIAFREGLFQGQLDKVPKDVPIPSGLRGCTFMQQHGLTAVLGLSQDNVMSIQSSYAKALAENGWSEAKPVETADDDVTLTYTKDGRELTLSIGQEDGGYRPVGINHYDAGTSPAARRAAAQPDMPETRDMVNKTIETYATCTSYRDTGTVKTVWSGDYNRIEEGSFSTTFIRPNRFRFEYSAMLPNAPKRIPLIFHSDATGTRVWRANPEPAIVQGEDFQKVIRFESLSMDRAGSLAPFMLLGLKDPYADLSRLFELKRLPNEEVNGTSCHRIDGQTDSGEIQSLWIDPQTMTLRRFVQGDTYEDNRMETTITYAPEVNIEIAPEELAFNPPDVLTRIRMYGFNYLVKFISHRDTSELLMAGSIGLLIIAVVIASTRKIVRRRSAG